MEGNAAIAPKTPSDFFVARGMFGWQKYLPIARKILQTKYKHEKNKKQNENLLLHFEFNLIRNRFDFER